MQFVVLAVYCCGAWLLANSQSIHFDVASSSPIPSISDAPPHPMKAWLPPTKSFDAAELPFEPEGDHNEFADEQRIRPA